MNLKNNTISKITFQLHPENIISTAITVLSKVATAMPGPVKNAVAPALAPLAGVFFLLMQDNGDVNSWGRCF